MSQPNYQTNTIGQPILQRQNQKSANRVNQNQANQYQDNRTEAQPHKQRNPLVEKLRNQLLSRGASGIKGIGRMWKQIDDDGSHSLTFKEFQEGMLNHHVNITNDEITQLYKLFDTDGNGTLSYDEFLINLRPPMSALRTGLIDKAFLKLDKTRDGRITCDDLANVYNVKQHPKFQNGEMTEQQILNQFLNSFEAGQHKDGIVTQDEFTNYYAGVSASIDSDIYFDVMMRNAWKL